MSKLPTLYHKAKGGDLRQWSVWTEGPSIVTEYGQVGGAMQKSYKLAESKNVGRSNATSPEEQATLEAKSLWTYKVERKYSETKEGAQEALYLPMLAHTFKEGKVKFPCYLQPKLDGVRCLASREGNKIVLTSRQGKPWNVPHLAKQLDWLSDDTVLDGEIYIHGESCQKITSLAKSADPDGKSYKEESKLLEYHIYDIPISNGFDELKWARRCELLQGYLKAAWMGKQIKIVQTVFADSEKNMWEVHDQFVEHGGYEGVILRLGEGKYQWGYRSRELLKVKKFQDSEFTVVDARDGRGKMEGKVVWVCKNSKSEATFECSMKVSMDERRQMYKDRKSYIGKQLTVRYFDLTDDGLPRFPVGIVFRDAIDLPCDNV